MSHRCAALSLLLLSLAFGCSSEDASGTPAQGPGAGGAMAGSGGTGGGTGGLGAGSGGTATGSGGAEAGSGGSDGSGGGACTAATGGTPTLQCAQLSGVCGTCMAEKCCDLVLPCSADTGCACMAECVAGASLTGIEGCLGSCGLAASPPGFGALAQCTSTTCPDGDECATPAGFTPPTDTQGGGSSASLGGGQLPDCNFDAGLAYDPNGEILQLQSADGGICARIDRRNEGSGALANTNWTLLELRVGPLGEIAHIADASAGCWYSSHHNFNDWIHAWSGSRHFDLGLAVADHGAAPTYQLIVSEGSPLGGQCPAAPDGHCPIGSPIELLPVR